MIPQHSTLNPGDQSRCRLPSLLSIEQVNWGRITGEKTFDLPVHSYGPIPSLSVELDAQKPEGEDIRMMDGEECSSATRSSLAGESGWFTKTSALACRDTF